jgi:hypothetical protein
MMNNDSLNTKGWKGDVTITRHDITVGLPARKLSQPYILQMSSE